ncbi:MAG: LacI family DNA-binding transcriptional regulator [Phycisphaerales bacterium]|nr:MAG: LacI family DNA-binding transcriptional regulator [Phycisphaerales bacterium]
MARSPRITTSDIAEALNLSRTTVSLALAGRGRRYRIPDRTVGRVLEAAREMDYRPSLVAQQLAGKRSRAAGVLVNPEGIADVRLIRAMEMLAAEHGVRFIVGYAVGTYEKVREYLDDFEARGVDTVVSIVHNHPHFGDMVLAELKRFEHVVFYEKPGESFGPGALYVQPDYFELGRLGVQHLIDRGRQRIGLVFSNLALPCAVQRRQAYEATLVDAGRTLDPALIWVLDEQTSEHWTAPFTPELALRALDALVVERKVDGIVAANDSYAARLLSVLRERGRRVPEDVAVVGCDNLELGTLVTPPLTTAGFDVEELAERMIEVMFAGLEGRDVEQGQRAVVVKPELVVRDSS